MVYYLSPPPNSVGSLLLPGRGPDNIIPPHPTRAFSRGGVCLRAPTILLWVVPEIVRSSPFMSIDLTTLLYMYIRLRFLPTFSINGPASLRKMSQLSSWIVFLSLTPGLGSKGSPSASGLHLEIELVNIIHSNETSSSHARVSDRNGS